MMDIDADIAMLGSGFAGSLMALVLHQEGFRVVVVDRATHPRFAIGESSTPIADMILRDLAARYDLPWLRPLSRYGTWKATYPELGVGRKRGFSYFHHHASQPFLPRADHANELLVAASSEDYLSDTHWMRADVDAFLAAEVCRAGIPLLENTEITSIHHENGWQLSGQQDEEGVTIHADFVMDGTGAGGVLTRALHLPDTAHQFHTRSRAIFAHVEGVRRWQESYERAGGYVADHPYDCDAAALHHVLDGAWMWQLRFDTGIVSAGLMMDAARYPLNKAQTPDAEWKQWVEKYPSLAEQFTNARLVAPPGRWLRTGPVQRRAVQVAGENWAMLPHTAGFVDPLHSTGIAHSLSGVERLANILTQHWQQPTLAAALASYGQAIQQELDFIDTLVATCYASMHDFRLFTASTMLYFAAVIHYERLRSESHAGEITNRLFLSADEPTLRQMASEALKRLRQGISAADYEAFVEESIRPFNTAGLFRPAVPNMYHHTVAQV